jgi:hypothetical protein
MAAYQGARPRAPLPLGLDALSRDGGRRGRRSAEASADRRAVSRQGSAVRSVSRAARTPTRRARPSSVGIALAAIVVVFSAAFLSLSQSVRVAATGYDIVRLASEQDRLNAIRQDLHSDVVRLHSEPAIRKQALDNGLGQLGAPRIVPAN